MKWRPIEEFDGFSCEDYMVSAGGVFYIAFRRDGEWLTDYKPLGDEEPGPQKIEPEWFAEIPDCPGVPSEKSLADRMRDAIRTLEDLTDELDANTP